jgi:hypothetical protein
MRVVQIVPQVLSQHDGVSAFAAALGRQISALGERTEMSPAFAIDGRSSPSGAFLLPTSLRDLSSGDAVLLHYVGYGYHRRGVPRALVARMKQLREVVGAEGVGVIFHEVWASGPPWRSSFWLMPLQRSIARRLLRLAGSASTSLELYRDLLARVAPERRLQLLPIPSTVGEPAVLPNWAARTKSLVIFGTPGVRLRAYRQEAAALQAAVAGCGIDEVIDIGEGQVAPSSVGSVPVRVCGRLPAEEVGRILLTSRAGFLAYPPDFLGKSTIFAAYAAHGTAPVVAWSGRGERPLHSDESWIRASGESLLACEARLPGVAAAARERYAERSLAHHATFWRDALGPR